MSPKRSKTPNVSPAFSTRVRSSASEDVTLTYHWSAMRTASSTRSGGRSGADLGYATVRRDVLARHALRREVPLEPLPATPSVDVRKAMHGRDGSRQVVDDEPRHALGHDLRYRTAAVSDHGRAARQRLDHHEAERLRPVDREKHSERAAEKRPLLAVGDLADELDPGSGKQRTDPLLEIGRVGVVDLRRNAQRHTRPARNRDRTVGPLLGRD